MKVKILNNKNYSSNEEFKVLSMNYDFVMIQFNDDKIVLKSGEVELLPESKGEVVFTKYKDILKIKLDNGIPMHFYAAFINFIEEIIENKVEEIDVLEDSYSFIKKGIWEKKLLVVINKSKVFRISAVGEKFGKDFRFTIKQVNLADFIDQCSLKVEKLQNEIVEKHDLKNRYQNSLKDLLSSGAVEKRNILLGS